jgi:hypothetical protein
MILSIESVMLMEVSLIRKPLLIACLLACLLAGLSRTDSSRELGFDKGKERCDRRAVYTM